MRLIDMLYVGAKEERKGYVRVEAKPAADAESTVGDHWITALPSISIPRRPARPVSCVYSPGVIGTWDSPLYLINFSKTTVRAGILIPSARVSVAKTALIRPFWKSSSTADLKLGKSPAWCAAIPRSSAVSQSSKPKTSRSSSAIFCVYLRAVARISSRSCVDVKRRPACKHCLTAASQPILEKMKVIAGKRF